MLNYNQMKNAILLIILSVLCGSAGATIVVSNGLTHEHDLTKGGSDQGFIEIRNAGDRPSRVIFYLQDMAADCKEQAIQPTDTGMVTRSNARWMQLGAVERLLAPGERYSLLYEINAPNEDLKGSYWSLLMVEEKPLIDTTQTRYGLNISSNVRYGIQIITTFPSSEEVQVNFESVELQEENGNKALAVKLFNESAKMVKPQVKMEVYNKAGELLFTETTKAKKLYPNQCRTFYLKTENLEIGVYQAVLVADCGNQDVFGLTVNLNVDE
jgi:hypothetical protein